MLDPHEEEVIRSFIHRRQRQRFLRRIANPIISCVPGKLAFFQDEDLGRRYILER